MAIVVDSSIFIAAERGQFDWLGFHTRFGTEPLSLSVVTLAELLHGAERADTAERLAKRLKFIADIEAHYPLLPFGRDEAAEYAKVWAELATRGALVGAHDQMIAATARWLGHGVATLNRPDFQRIAGLQVIDAAPFRVINR